MNRNFHNSGGSSTQAGSPIPRRRIIFIALMLALAIGSAGQTVPAQAAPASANEIKFEVGIYPEKLPKVRVCEELKLYVGVHKTVYKNLGGKDWPLPGYTPGPKLVTGERTSGTGELKKQLGDIDDPGASVPFVFKPSKLGKVTLKFTATINSAWVGANEQVIGSDVEIAKEIKFTVIPCKVKVKTVSQFPVPQLYNITVMSDDAVMAADEAGAFTGSTTMSWAYSEIAVPECDFSISAADSQADLTGNLDDEGGQFTATASFQPTTVSATICCPVVGCRTVSDQGSLDPLTFSVASSGGVSIQTATGQGVSGLAHIIVTSEDGGAAFIPGNHQVSWDDFSSLFGILLALH